MSQLGTLDSELRTSHLAPRAQNLKPFNRSIMPDSVPSESVWQQLKTRKITCDQALSLLVDDQGVLNLNLLDREVTYRFLRQLPDRTSLPPLVPLLLWRNCYYLGSPVQLEVAEIDFLKAQTGTEIQIIPIRDRSYIAWHHAQNFKPNSDRVADSDSAILETESESIGAQTELDLAKAEDQIGRIKAIIAGALRHRASDIHLEPTSDGLGVRYRIDGILRNITKLPLDVSRRAVVALKVMADMDISESRRPQDARISDRYATQEETGLGLDMRVSTLPCVGGEKAVIRLLPRQNPFSNIEELGFTETALARYKSWLKQPQGMVIFTGPTGSGKTSTLYTTLQAIATEHVNVVTVEDPVEYVLPRITQTQVHEAAGMTFAAGLRAILRQDPDIIMVGEIRDHETAETAIRAALTGHLVLTTLHTNDAVSAIPRLKDIGPDPGLVSDALLGIVAQRLARKVCSHCSEPYIPTEQDLRVLGIDLEQANPQSWRRGKGCSHCFNSGYLGREALIEVLNVDTALRRIIYEGNMTQLHHYLNQNLNQSGFTSFQATAIAKVTTGKTTVEEILRVLPHNALYQKVHTLPPVPEPLPTALRQN